MNVASSMKGTVDSKKMGKNPKCVNVKKVALYQKVTNVYQIGV